MFSKKQRRGCQPPKTFRAGGKIIRELVIQLKNAGYIQNYGGEEETNSGLFLTKTGSILYFQDAHTRWFGFTIL